MQFVFKVKIQKWPEINIINTNIPETQHEQIISIMPYAFQILLKKSHTTNKIKITQNYPQHCSSIPSSSGVTTIMILMCVPGARMPACVHEVGSVVSNSWNAMGCSPPDSPVHGVLQAKILEWVAMPCSRGLSQPRN